MPMNVLNRALIEYCVHVFFCFFFNKILRIFWGFSSSTTCVLPYNIKKTSNETKVEL